MVLEEEDTKTTGVVQVGGVHWYTCPLSGAFVTSKLHTSVMSVAAAELAQVVEEPTLRLLKSLLLFPFSPTSEGVLSCPETENYEP